MKGGAYSILLHCFSSGRGLADCALALGGYVSFSGILTFPKSHDLREIARDVPADRLLVETDSPFLAPVPYRGKRNEPAYVAETARHLAEVRDLSPEALSGADDRQFPALVRTDRLDLPKVVMLGCGGSAGVPQLGGADGTGDWGACNKLEPRNRRTRSSIVIEGAGRRAVAD